MQTEGPTLMRWINVDARNGNWVVHNPGPYLLWQGRGSHEPTGTRTRAAGVAGERIEPPSSPIHPADFFVNLFKFHRIGLSSAARSGSHVHVSYLLHAACFPNANFFFHFSPSSTQILVISCSQSMPNNTPANPHNKPSSTNSRLHWFFCLPVSPTNIQTTTMADTINNSKPVAYHPTRYCIPSPQASSQRASHAPTAALFVFLLSQDNEEIIIVHLGSRNTPTWLHTSRWGRTSSAVAGTWDI